jgi:hypothetical protein
MFCTYYSMVQYNVYRKTTATLQVHKRNGMVLLRVREREMLISLCVLPGYVVIEVKSIRQKGLS